MQGSEIGPNRKRIPEVFTRTNHKGEAILSNRERVTRVPGGKTQTSSVHKVYPNF